MEQQQKDEVDKLMQEEEGKKVGKGKSSKGIKKVDGSA